jgi:hypothetical protein
LIKIAVVSFVTGFLAVGLVLAGSVLALTILADVQEWASFGLGKGPFTIFDTDVPLREPRRSSASALSCSPC